MSDPAKDGYTCCDQPMIAMVPAELELMLGGLDQPAAFACLQCEKWRHVLQPGSVFRPIVVKAMNDWADRHYQERMARDGRR